MFSRLGAFGESNIETGLNRGVFSGIFLLENYEICRKSLIGYISAVSRWIWIKKSAKFRGRVRKKMKYSSKVVGFGLMPKNSVTDI